MQLNTRVISHQQGASPWHCWRTWSPARFTWWKFLRPTTWVMGRFLIRWSWQYEQICPLVMIPGSPVAPHTPQVSGNINITLTESHDILWLRSSFHRTWNWFILRPHSCMADSVAFIPHSLFWWLLPPGPEVNDRDHCGSLHRSHLHHHLRFHHRLQRQKQVLHLSEHSDGRAHCP